jgi:hypothetical protein
MGRSITPLGQTRISRWLGMPAETFVRADVSDSNVSVYIYEDGAELQIDGKCEGSYERPDFRSLEHLQEQFVSDVVEAVGTAKPRC